MAKIMGADVAERVSVEQWKSFIDSGVEFAIVRCFRSLGIVDTACPTTVANAIAAGISEIDVYHYPFLGTPPEVQAQTTLEFLASHNVHYGRVFLDVEQSHTPWTDHDSNLDFIRRFIAEITKHAAVGIYTGTEVWKRLTGDSSEFSKLPLWWSSHGKLYAPFGGWTAPAVVQARYEQMLDGVDYDLNYKSASHSAGAERDLFVTKPMMRGDDVRDLQETLKSLGYGEPDGWYGSITAEAVRAFQRDHGLRPDGNVGPFTRRALASAEAGETEPARLPRPCLPSEAVARALSLVGNGGTYELGTGDYRPTSEGGTLVDVPWTHAKNGSLGSDCSGFALSWCYKIRRHRPGLNVGPWSTVSDDLNCSSAIEDADHEQDLFVRATGTVQPGDLIVYPTIKLPDNAPFIGHVGIVTGVARAATFDLAKPDYSLLDVAQCHGPNGRVPGVVASDGAIWNRHDLAWPSSEHRTAVLRAKS